MIAWHRTQKAMNQRTQDRGIKEFARCVGKKNWICKSLAMEMGINTGVGRCLGCDTFLHITYNPERQEMDLERFEDYQNSKKARDDVDKIAGNVGYGGQDDDRI